ncbi:1-acylglycerol-3-phosphate O-acyltransferase [Campylobacter blaseri]|uniref:1-acyl-sn-glycerol-3-phosphate acyltransferase n=1 Tax=Campylobacter blaseri TaxID=2042961 RepID=A0A2P8R479_9BACT|nr:lysophospholipid acyltransferase family protein [Campylobacter blaseri]PSM53285.1 1-acyl-sn-glycerol-3-phosphate acyltransferase [Campylobacter blaseri]PSM54751.1 1-acyl-sn-glycerol-3-phosphate acyltransferase [Campylobacter blaseri]QKF86767.1 1-acylglycerol-3-phosphate O-acyltransferase [Campylobacter blaseri]
MAKIRGIFYCIYCVLSICFIIFLMMMFKNKNHKIRNIWAKFQRYFIGYKLQKIGEFDENADIILINHKSMLDIIILEELYPKNLSWVAKKEIGDIFFLGKILTLPKMISVDRNNPRSIVTLIRDVKDRLKDGRVIAMFPEGTRGRDEKLLKFQDGAKVLVDKLNLKVQPIVLKNTVSHFDVKKFEVRGGEIKVFCMEVFDVSDENWYKNLREKMQKVYDEL